MEAAREEAGLLEKIRPPRLEDAGLEDCTLPPESIKEAFFKAATAASIFHPSDGSEDPECVSDPWPTAGERSDSIVGITPAPVSTGPCGADKDGSFPEVHGDKVVVVGGREGEGKNDEAVEPEVPEEVKGCVGGLQGLKIEEKQKGDDVDEEGDKERPTLAETCV